MTDINAVAKSFTDYYYAIFDRSRAELAPLYKDESMLTFEGQQFQGTANIVKKLQELPFKRVQHQVSTVDAQPANPEIASILVTVTGGLLVDDETKAQLFSQTFQLIPENNSWFVYNDTFRLCYV